MHGLLIRQPYIDMILDGRKTWEMRSSRCHVRGPLALIQSGTNTVVGVADLIDCIGPLSDQERLANANRHCVALDDWENPKFKKYRFAWVLSNARRVPQPIPYHHRPGAVIWVQLDNSVALQLDAFISKLQL